MCKAIDRSITMGNIELLKKSGDKNDLYLSESTIGKFISLSDQNNESIYFYTFLYFLCKLINQYKI